ncbi:MAG: nth 1 [Phycisphaerales bacterium]|nr:nth 1 [Phycisphaerales bacterium]
MPPEPTAVPVSADPLRLPPRDKLLLAHERLCAAYACPIPYFHGLDPLSELVSSLLSHRTRNADSGRAFKALRQKFPTWAAVRDAPTHAVQDAIAVCTWPEQKAPRVQDVLRRVTERRRAAGAPAGEELSLDFLAALSPADARAWLGQMPGVGPKTQAAVLSFSSLRGRALPVDSHHHRVAVRLGIIPESLAVGPSHAVMEAMLPPDWDAQQVYDHHEVLMLHGQRCCFYAAPACERCQVLDLCPHGRARLGGEPAGASVTAAGRPRPSAGGHRGPVEGEGVTGAAGKGSPDPDARPAEAKPRSSQRRRKSTKPDEGPTLFG